MADACTHLGDLSNLSPPTGPGCYECTLLGATWVHLRRCVECGHVGCCDDSPNRHATKHFHGVSHPLIQSYEPGEDWFWCYVDELLFEVPALSPSPSHP